MAKKRTIPIRAYLEKTEHRDSIKNMMMTLFPEVSKTQEEWEAIDKEINERRC
jgi:hypothetical protein